MCGVSDVTFRFCHSKMDTNLEGQLVESLIRLLLTAEGAKRERLFSSLTRLSSFEKILEYIMKVFCRSETIETKQGLAHLYFEYVKAKTDMIHGISSSLLFEHFKYLVGEVPKIETETECLVMVDVLRIFISALSTFSPTALLSAITSWGSQHSLLAVSALVDVHPSVVATFFPMFLTALDTSIEIMTVAYEFLRKHRITDIEEDRRDPEAQAKLAESLTKVFRECAWSENPTTLVAGFRLLGGAFHFMEDSDALVFCLNISEDIVQGIRYPNRNVTVTALQALCELPLSSDVSVFNAENQITTFVPLFANHVKNFDDDIADAVIRFVDPRKEECDLRQWLIGMFKKDTVDAARIIVLLACRYQLVSVVQDYVFPAEYDSPSIAVAACSAIDYLANNKSLTPELVPKALRTVMVAMSIDDQMVSLAIPVTLQEILNASGEIPSILFNSLVVNLELVHDRHSLFLLASGLLQYCSTHQSLEITPCDTGVFAGRVYQILVVYINTPKESMEIQSILLFLLTVLHAVIRGGFVPGETLDGLSVASICEKIIPPECVDLVHERALSCLETEPAASVICISLKNTKKPNPDDLFDKVKDAEPFNPLIFEHFFHSAATIDRSGAVVMLGKLVAELSEEGKKKPVLTSIFKILSGDVKPKYSRELILTAITFLVSDQLTSDEVSELFSILECVLRQDTQSLTVLILLVKLHIPAKIPPSLIEKILSPYFVLAIPHLLKVCQVDLGLFNACFDLVFRSGDVGLFHAFCEICKDLTDFEVFDALLTNLLAKTNNWKFVFFSEQVCEELSQGKTSHKKLELMARLVDDILCEQKDVRTSAMNGISALFGMDKEEGTDDELFGEFVEHAHVLCENWSGKISDYEALDIASIIIKTRPLSLPHAIFLSKICKAQPRVVSATHGIVEFLFQCGDQEDVHTLKVVRELIIHISKVDFALVYGSVMKLKLNDFAKDVLSGFVTHPELGGKILNEFFDYFVDYRLTDDDSVLCGRYQLAELIFRHNQDRSIDFRLLWIILANYTFFLDPKQKLSRGLMGTCLTSFNISLRSILTRLGLNHVELSSWKSCSDIVEYFHDILVQMSLSDLESFVDARHFIQLRRVSGVLMVSSFAILLARLFGAVKSHSNLRTKIATEIGAISVCGKDDSAKLITARLVSLLDITALQTFDQAQLTNLMDAGRRALIRPNKETQADNIAFLKNILAVAPPDLIKENKRCLMETLRTAFEFCTVEDLLDAIKVVMSCDSELEQVNNMAQISLPRIIILSVNEQKSVRDKATSILVLVSRAKNKSKILEGLVDVLGLPEVATLSHFFVDWLVRGGLNSYSIELLLSFTNVLSSDKQTKTDFAKKVAPLLKPIMIDPNNPLQDQALDIMSRLLA